MIVNRKNIMADECTTDLMKEALKLTEGKDPVQSYYDFRTITEILKEELEEHCKKEDHEVDLNNKLTCSFPPYR